MLLTAVAISEMRLEMVGWNRREVMLEFKLKKNYNCILF